MADIAALPRPESRPRHWRIWLRDADAEPIEVRSAKLGSADAAFIKFITSDGLITMIATEVVFSCEEFKD